MAQDDAIVGLSRQIDAARKAERFLVNADEVANLRRHGPCELHRICADFVSSVNATLSEAELGLAPATYAPESFQEPGAQHALAPIIERLAKFLQRGLEHSPDIIPEFRYHELREDTVPFRVVFARGAGAAAASRVRSQRIAVRHLLRPSDALFRKFRYLVRNARCVYFEIH